VLFARQQTSSEALETLQRVSGWLSRAVTRVEVASATVTHGAAGLRADAGSVFVHDQASTLLSMAAVGLDGAASDEWMRGFGERAIEEDRLIVATTDERHPQTVLAAPLKILDHTAGAMVFQFASRREFAPAELAMAITLASRCAGALERASFYERERQSVLMLQRRLLPQVPSIPAWLEVGYRYEPAAGGQVGGDWFQLINVDEERVVAVVGDAVGHGLGAAAAMGQLKSSIATAVSIDPDPAEVLRIVDRFADVGTETMAATAVAALLDRRGVARLAAAGHPPPVFVDAAGVADVLDGGRRPLLGYGNGRPGDAAQRLLVGGDLMLLYSDGLVERRHEVLDVGVERLRDLLVEMRDQPPQSICDQLVERLATDGHDDDVALLLVRYVGEALPPG
jgi:serine phosphatase RsbU (regulator of sigma subunit)